MASSEVDDVTVVLSPNFNLVIIIYVTWRNTLKDFRAECEVKLLKTMKIAVF